MGSYFQGPQPAAVVVVDVVDEVVVVGPAVVDVELELVELELVELVVEVVVVVVGATVVVVVGEIVVVVVGATVVVVVGEIVVVVVVVVVQASPDKVGAPAAQSGFAMLPMGQAKDDGAASQVVAVPP